MSLTLSQREKKIQKLKLKLEGDKLNHHLMSKYNYLEAEQKKALANMLYEENTAFRAVTTETAALLVNQDIHFKTTRENGGIHSNYTRQLRGAIHNNGYLYLINHANTRFWSIWNQYITPHSYTGRINALGLADVDVIRVSGAIIGNRVPQRFIGYIQTNGELYLKVTESYWEAKGNYFVKNIIGDPFVGNEQKRTAFLEKRRLLYADIAALRKKLLK